MRNYFALSKCTCYAYTLHVSEKLLNFCSFRLDEREREMVLHVQVVVVVVERERNLSQNLFPGIKFQPWLPKDKKRRKIIETC